ncbi:MAG TPA: inorganic phosphate transporter, partial [Xanthobacteraceae bacterium]
MAQTTKQSLNEYTHGATVADPRGTLSTFIRTHQWSDDVLPAMAALTGSIADQVKASGTFAKVPAAVVTNVRNDMYLTSEAVRVFDKDKHHT